MPFLARSTVIFVTYSFSPFTKSLEPPAAPAALPATEPTPGNRLIPGKPPKRRTAVAAPDLIWPSLYVFWATILLETAPAENPFFCRIRTDPVVTISVLSAVGVVSIYNDANCCSRVPSGGGAGTAWRGEAAST